MIACEFKPLNLGYMVIEWGFTNKNAGYNGYLMGICDDKKAHMGIYGYLANI